MSMEGNNIRTPPKEERGFGARDVFLRTRFIIFIQHANIFVNTPSS
jgi:hypothetical protein